MILNTVPVVCGCLTPNHAGRFGSCQEYFEALGHMKKLCHCGEYQPGNKKERYELRKIEFTGGICNRNRFIKEFPMHARGVFVVLDNHDHCVVFDASR